MNTNNFILEVELEDYGEQNCSMSEINTLLHRGLESYNKLKGKKLNICNITARYPSDMEEAIQKLVDIIKEETQKKIKESL